MADRSRRATFNEAANLYDRFRPGYPETLVGKVLEYAGLSDRAGKILEVGCGTGQATRSFARRGHAIACVELGADLAALARKNLREFPGVSVENLAFEEWPLQRAAFDMVLSAQAFHWVDPAVAYVKAAAALVPNGTLALLWNSHPGAETEFHHRVQEVYDAYTPEMSGPHPSLDERIQESVDPIDGSGLFGPVTVLRERHAIELDADGYLKLLDTFSDHRALEASVRARLDAGIREVIRGMGGKVERPYVAVATLARLRMA